MKKIYKTIPIIFVAILIWSCDDAKKRDSLLNTDKLKIERIHKRYVDGWLEMDKEKILELFEENARIQPNRLGPIEGKLGIRKFWFPNDSSKTIIDSYTSEIINITVLDTLAISTHTSLLDWSYQKDTIGFGMIQKGINTTIYRKQADSSWKIWRSMWTDIYSKKK